jgi:hypothetical protein
LYREKPSKASKRKSVSIVEPGSHSALVPRNAYVKDNPEGDVPPAVLAPPIEAVNVFDYLVSAETPNASRTSLGGSHEPITIKKDAPAIFAEGKDERILSRAGYKNKEDDNYVEHGFSYSAEPVKPLLYPHPNGSLVSLDFMTPSAKAMRASPNRIGRPAHSRTNSGNASDKKRKRGEVDEQHYGLEGDTVMPDAPKGANAKAETPGLAHSGHTGALTRLHSHLRGYRDVFIPKRFSGRAERSITEYYAPRALSRDAIFDADPRSKNQVELTYSGLQDTKLKPELQGRGKAFQEASGHFGLPGPTSQNKEYQGAYFGPPEDSNQATLSNWVLTEDELAARLKVDRRY